MPRRIRDTLGKFLPNTATSSNSQPPFFFIDGELEAPLVEKTNIFEEPIGEEEEEEPIPTEPMDEHLNDRGDKGKIVSAFPIRETNGDTKMKNISPSALPHFHGLTTKDPDTFLFEFIVVC